MHKCCIIHKAKGEMSVHDNAEVPFTEKSELLLFTRFFFRYSERFDFVRFWCSVLVVCGFWCSSCLVGFVCLGFFVLFLSKYNPSLYFKTPGSSGSRGKTEILTPTRSARNIWILLKSKSSILKRGTYTLDRLVNFWILTQTKSTPEVILWYVCGNYDGNCYKNLREYGP